VEAILRTLSNRREQLPPLGRDLLGMMGAYAAHRYPEALQHARDADKVAPRDPMVTLWIGFLAKYSNRPRQAVDAYDRFGPRPYAGHEVGVTWMIHLCGSLHMLGEHRRELDEALAALGRIEQLNRDIDAGLAVSPTGGTPGALMLEAASELRAHGHHQASVALCARAVAWYHDRLRSEPGKEEWRARLVAALRGAERWEDAYDSCRTLSEKAPQDPDYRGQLGCLAARLGKRDEAMRISTELQELSGPYLFGAQTYRRACIAALLGEKQKALELLRESFAEGVPYSTRHHREIDLEPLWDYPPFQELIRPKG
jgi:tetratricopeptide (TPR) repeat protein